MKEIPLPSSETNHFEEKLPSLKEGKFRKFLSYFKLKSGSTTSNIVLTILFYYCYLCVGFLNAILGPLLTHMQRNTGVNEDQITWILTTRGMGLVIGTPIAGILYNYFKKDDTQSYKWYSITINRVLLSFMLLMAFFLILVPFTFDYTLLLANHLFQGACSGVAEVGCNLAIAWVWRGKVRPFLQALHCFSGLGSLLFPLIIAQVFTYITDPSWQIMISYVLCGILVCIAAIPLIILPAPKCTPVSQSERRKREIKRKKSKKGTLFQNPKKFWQNTFVSIFSFPTFIYCLTAVIKGTATGGYTVFGNLIYQYCERKKLGTPVELAYLTTIFWLSFTIGRFSGIFLSIFMQPFWMLFFTIGGTVYAYVLMMLFKERIMIIWAGTIVHGLFTAPISASSMGLPQSSFKIPLNAISTSIVSFGSTIGEMIIALIVTLLLPILGVETVLIANLTIFIITFLDFVCIFIFGKLYMTCVNRKKVREREMEEEKAIERHTLEIHGRTLVNLRNKLAKEENKSEGEVLTKVDINQEKVKVEEELKSETLEIEMGERSEQEKNENEKVHAEEGEGNGEDSSDDDENDNTHHQDDKFGLVVKVDI